MPRNLAMDFLQGASNAAASNVSGPVDLLALALRKMGFPVPEDPVLGAKWMADRGITAQPQNRVAGMLGETAGLVAPIAAAARAPQIASGMLQAGENLAASRTLNPQRGALLYQIEHKPMTKAGGASTLDDLVPSFGEDIYGKNALQFFGSGDPRERSIVRTLAALRGKPDAPVTIYRGVPSEAKGINAGDWVTIDPKVAADYAAQHPGGRVVSMQVPASHVTSWADSLMEFGYHPATLSDLGKK